MSALIWVSKHFSGGGHRTATYLTRHLASHGYVVAAMDHSEVVAPELGPRPGESAAGRARRIDAIIASRVPDVRLLLSAFTGPGPIAGLDGIELQIDVRQSPQDEGRHCDAIHAASAVSLS